MLHEILGARAHADAALAAARLPAVGVHRGALEVAAARHGDGHVFHGHQVFQPDFAGVLDDLGAPLVAVILLDLAQFLDDHVAKNLVRTEDLQVPGDAPLDLRQFVQNLLLLHAGEPLQLQLDDGLGLLLGKLESRDQAVARILRLFGRADDADHFVEVVEGFLEAQQEMLAVARLAQFEFGAAAHHIDAVVDEEPQHVHQAQLARLAVDDGQHDDAETHLQSACACTGC